MKRLSRAVLLRLFPVAAAPLLCAGPPARAQGYLVWQFTGSATSDRLGRSVAGPGDLDGDGFADPFAGAPQLNSSPPAGYARAFSGATGAILLTLVAPPAMGDAVAGIGDLDGDGLPDLLLGSPTFTPPPGMGPALAGQARVVSGATQALIRAMNGVNAGESLGLSVAEAGDVDGDGQPDVIAGASANLARVFSGATGALLRTWSGTGPLDNFGCAVAGVGDLDGDGSADLMVGARQTFVLGAPGYARVFSGATGSTLFTLAGTAYPELFGAAVAGVGDVDGDGVPDLLVGSPAAAVGGVFNSGQARVFSGATFGVLFDLSGSASLDRFGTSVAGAGDVNGDGVPDFAVGAPQNGSLGSAIGYVRVFSGAGGTPICTIPGAAAGEQFALSIAGAGDVNGDGFPDLVGGAPLSNAGGPLQSGAARVHSVVGIPPGSSLFGTDCAGSGGFAPLLAAQTSAPSIGSASFGIVLSKALGGSFAVLDVGLSSTSWLGVPLPLNLGFLGLPACSLHVSPDVPLLVATNGSGPGNGRAFVPLPIPPDPTLTGAHVFFQWYVVDPGPAPLPGAMSRGLDLLIL